MAAVIEVIGVISGILGIVQFGIDNFSEEPEPGSDIAVAVALDGAEGGTSNAGGDLPDVRIWNEYVDFVGITADPGTVEDGEIGEIHVDHDNQGVYTLLSANDDAICIAWVTTTWSTGGNKYAVSGDFGKECGGTWYASGMYPTPDRDYQPSCFWIDANGDQPNTGVQFRWPAYSGDAFDPENTDPSSFCNNIDFGLRTEEDPSTITYPARKEKAKRQGGRPAWMSRQLTVSDSVHHSAAELCGSGTSLGPDFAHTVESLFCDMSSKTLYGFCGSEAAETLDNNDGCFDFDSKAIVGSVSATSQDLVGSYTLLRDWRNGNMTTSEL